MAALSWLGGSNHQVVEQREERAVISGARCLEALLGGGLEALFGGGSPELQRCLLPSVGCSRQWVFHGTSVDLGCKLGRVLVLHMLEHLIPQRGQLHTFPSGWRMFHQVLNRSS